MTTVGILGGGQLARMLALSGAPLGLRFLVMDATADACAGQFAPMVVGDYRDEAALAEFASRIDVATFDFENVPAESAQWLSERVPVFPSPGALATAQDRLAEKTLFRELGIPVPRIRGGRIARRNSTPRSRPSAHRQSSRPGDWATTARASSGFGPPAMPMRRGPRWARRRPRSD